MFPYGKQTIEQDDISEVIKALQSDYLTTGPQISKFEQELAKKVGAKEAVAVGNGTQALHIACIAAGLGPGDYAIVPTLTFLATANAVRYCGADVIFCDSDPDTGLIDIEALKVLLETNKDKNIKAVLPVHLAGQLVDLPAIRKLADEYGLKIIADTCHALGSTSTKEETSYKAGECRYEDMATFSFHPVKTIATGEGGAITTNNSKLADRMRRLRSHGMEHKTQSGPWFYEMNELGYNYRITDIQCALGLSQLKKLDRFIEERRELAKIYDKLLAQCAPLILPPKREDNQNTAWHLYALRVDFEAIGKSRAEVMMSLREKGIGTQVHYIPVHTQPYYEALYGKQELPGANRYYERTLSIPLYPLLEKEDAHKIIQEISEIMK